MATPPEKESSRDEAGQQPSEERELAFELDVDAAERPRGQVWEPTADSDDWSGDEASASEDVSFELAVDVGPGTPFVPAPVGKSVPPEPPAPVDEPAAPPPPPKTIAEVGLDEDHPLTPAMIALDAFVKAARQYGPSHPEAQRRMPPVFEATSAALEQMTDGIRLQVLPYCLSLGDRAAWEPKPPSDVIPYALSAAGVREIDIESGVEADELRELLGVMLGSADAEPHDIAVALWEAPFRHIRCHIEEELAPGDDALEEVFADAADVKRRLEQRIASLDDAVHEEAAQAMLRLDEASLTRLAAATRLGTDELHQRHHRLLLDAFEDAAGRRDLDALVSAVGAYARRLVHRGRDGELFETHRALVRHLDARAQKGKPSSTGLTAAFVTATLFPRDVLYHVVQTATGYGNELADDTRRAAALDAFVRITEVMNAQALPIFLQLAERVRADPVVDPIIRFVVRVSGDAEEKLVPHLERVEPTLAQRILRAIVEVRGDEVKEKLSPLVKSKNSALRCEALALLTPSQAELTQELMKLFASRDPRMRMAALDTFVRHKVRSAGPRLVSIVEDETFSQRALEEQRYVLESLWQLNPARTEKLLSEVVSKHGLMKNDELDVTRILAARMLAERGDTQRALEALQTAEARRPWNSVELRDVASAGVKALLSRGDAFITGGLVSTETSELAARAREDDAATRVLLALHQLARQAVADDDAHQRSQRALAEAASAYASLAGENVTFHFSERTVHVGQRLLRGDRSTYDAARQMRNLLAKLDVSQISIGHDVPIADLARLQRAFRAVMAGGGDDGSAPTDLSRVRLRAGPRRGALRDLDELSPQARAAEIYALAVAVVRRFHEELRLGSRHLTSHVRRVSEELIRLSTEISPVLLGTIVCRPALGEAERTVSAALLALCMAQQLTRDQRLLRWLATGALLCDVGRPRVTAGKALTTSLAKGQYGELPGATAFVTTAIGRLTDAGMMRSVVVYESLHVEHRDELEPIYDGERGPAMLSRLLACARTFERRSSKGGAVADVVAELASRASDEVDRWIVQLLMTTLTVFPTGTVVELEDGRWARVVSPPLDRIDFGRPLVRIVGRPGESVESQLVDLARPDEGSSSPRIVRIVAAADEEQPDIVEPRVLPKTGRRKPSFSRIAAPVPVSDVAPDSEGRRRLQGAHVPRAPLIARNEPTASGTMEKSPLVHLLVYAADNDLEGTLLFTSNATDGTGKERNAIHFREGRPYKTQSTGVPTLRMSDLAADDADKRILQHMVDDVGYMMQLPPETEYGYFAGSDLLAGQPEACEIRGDPLPLIMMGVRKYLDYDTFDEVLPRIANTPLVLHERASPARLGLRPAERAIVMLIRDKETTLNDMLADEDVDEDAAQRTIYALAITRQLVMGSEKRLPVAHSR